MADLLVTNVRPDAGAPADILIRDGRIEAIGASLPRPPGISVEDGGGAIAIAPFVEPHVHLDKILWGLPWHSINVPPSLRAMIDNEVEIRRTLPWSVRERAGNLMRQCVAMGSTHIRSHVDAQTAWGIGHVEAMLDIRRRYADLVDLQLVTFPQGGMLCSPGAVALMEQSLALGVDAVAVARPTAKSRSCLSRWAWAISRQTF